MGQQFGGKSLPKKKIKKKLQREREGGEKDIISDIMELE